MKSARFAILGLVLLAQAQDNQPYIFLESQLQPRDTVTTVAAPLSIAPSQYWEGNDGSWTSFALRLGQPKGQVVRVFPSTKASHVIAVVPQGCPDGYYPSSAQDANTVLDCEFSRGGFFMYNESNGWIDTSIFTVPFQDVFGHPSNGYFGFDKVGLGYIGSAGSVNHQVIAAVGDPNYWFGSLPLNPRPVNFSTIESPQYSLLQSLKTTRNISSLSWGYTAGAKYRSDNFYGSLTLGGYDPARFDNSSQIIVNFAGDIERDLTVKVNSITTTQSNDPIVSKPMSMTIDSTVPYLYLPDFAYKAFETAFHLEWNSTLELYIVNVTNYEMLIGQNTVIKFDIGSTTHTIISFPIKAFLLNASFPLVPVNQSSYYFPIKRANESNQWTLGRAFLQEAYVIADYEQNNFTLAPCIWPDDATQSPPSSPRLIRSTDDNSNHTLSTGAIVGVVVGGIFAGLLLAGLITYLYTRRRRRQRTEALKHSSVTHTRSPSSATLPGGRPRAGSRIASFFRNPWGSISDTGAGPYELPEYPKDPTPAEQAMASREREHKRHFSNELDAEVNAVYEMYQPRPPAMPEMQGDEPFPTFATFDGSTIDSNARCAAEEEWERERRECELAPDNVFEMDATVRRGAGGGETPLPSPPLPSPGQIDAVARKDREDRERLQAERAEAERVRVRELERRVSGGTHDAIEIVDGRLDAERVGDLSPISEGTGFSKGMPDAGSRRVSRD